LYGASIDRIYRYVFFRVTDTELAEDLTSEVFLKAWENLRRYRPGGPFIAWLYTIARNTVIDHYRTRKPSVPLDQTLIRQDPGLDEKVDLQHEVETLKQAMPHLTESSARSDPPVHRRAGHRADSEAIARLKEPSGHFRCGPASTGGDGHGREARDVNRLENLDDCLRHDRTGTVFSSA
jgi:DNA-directed RNA polymerase specialized sigma24 family protein